jgi:hypothetical protein
MAKPPKIFVSTVWIFADAIAALEYPNRLEEIDDRFVYGQGARLQSPGLMPWRSRPPR